MKTMKASKKRGLTLVEILIVIALIAAVSVIAVPSFLRNHQNANSKSFAETLKQIAQKMEMIFWGQNPNEYPPITAFPNNLRTWAAPTNLGNIDDLERLIQKACEEIRKKKFSAAIVSNSTLLGQELYNCLNENTIDYIVTEDLQNYWMNVDDPYTTGYYSIGDGLGNPKYNDPPPTPPTPPACEDGNADAGEACGEPGLGNCASGYECSNCACIAAPPECGNGIVESGESCEPSLPSSCGPGYYCNVACHCQLQGSGCFLPGTNILMADQSSKPIEEVEIGDSVLSFDEKARENLSAKVTQVFKHDESNYLIINGKLQVTPNHPMYVNEGWQAIGDAKVGDLLKRADGYMFEIETIEPVQEPVTVYNLEVDQTHTYYAEKTLAHNKGGSFCFVGDTHISMADGNTKPISEIKVGDMVSSYDEDAKKVVASEVTKLLVHDPEIYWIVNGRIKVTPNHSFYIDGKWKQIGEVHLGEKMLTLDGNPEPITKIELITNKEPVYNLEIKNTHTYYAEGVMVHNAQKGVTRETWALTIPD